MKKKNKMIIIVLVMILSSLLLSFIVGNTVISQPAYAQIGADVKEKFVDAISSSRSVPLSEKEAEEYQKRLNAMDFRFAIPETYKQDIKEGTINVYISPVNQYETPQEWFTVSVKERVRLSQIPNELLKKMSTDELIIACLNYNLICDLYVCDRYFPDKAIDVLDIASVRAKNKKQTQLEEKNIIDVIEDLFKVKIEKGNKAQALKKSLSQILIGQNEAINTIIEQISYIEMGINDENRPLGVFLFVGPTGVGKTETAKQIALNYFGNKDKYIKLDMSEYSEPSSVTKLIGSPPGYVGFERQSLLVDHIRKNPHSVVVLDEVEKAHRDVLDIFLSVFDEGYFYESSKKRVDFKNTIIIMTSNLGFNEKMFHKNKIGYVDNQVTQEDIHSVVSNHFRPEFLNRIDCIVYFNLLDQDTCIQLAKDYLQEYAKKAHYEFASFDEMAKEIANQQEGKQYGARGLKRLAKKMLISKIKETEGNKIKTKSV